MLSGNIPTAGMAGRLCSLHTAHHLKARGTLAGERSQPEKSQFPPFFSDFSSSYNPHADRHYGNGRHAQSIKLIQVFSNRHIRDQKICGLDVFPTAPSPSQRTQHRTQIKSRQHDPVKTGKSCHRQSLRKSRTLLSLPVPFPVLSIFVPHRT